MDMTKAARDRREQMRWNILKMLHLASPYTSGESQIINVMRAIYSDITIDELRKQMDYLADRGLIDIEKKASGQWFADIGRYGVDIVEYTIDCDPGIARPAMVA